MLEIYRAIAAGALTLATIACGRAAEPANRAPDSLRTAAPAAPSAAPSTATALTATPAPCGPSAERDSVCFHASRAHDFAGDGRPFTITVDARGPARDSMRVALRITRGDTTFYRADWTTTLYGAYDAKPIAADSVRRRTDAQLARLLADSAFRPTRAFLGGATNVDRMLRETIGFDVAVAEERKRRGLTPADTLPLQARESPRPVTDSARVAALAAELRNAAAFRYFAGGEVSYAVAWSRAEHRFVVVYACC